MFPRKRVGNVLGKDAHGVLTGGTTMDRARFESKARTTSVQVIRRVARGETGLPFVVGHRRVDLAVVVGLILSGTSQEVG